VFTLKQCNLNSVEARTPLVSYLGNYGGVGLIPVYWDLLYLMVFSLVIFVLAY